MSEETHGEYEDDDLRAEAEEATKDIDVFESGHSNEGEAEEFASKIIKRAASLKAVKINRERFLRSELKKHCPDIDMNLALEQSPSVAGVPARVIDEIAVETIDLETKKCASLSFLAGLPGGVALVGTVPADLAQYFAHVMRVEQKLAYLYGWQSFLDDEDEVDDQTVMNLVVLMGVMLEVGGAANAITKFASEIAQKGVQKTIQRQALTKTTFYPVLKSVLKVLGVQLTKESFAKTVSKVVPVVGGAISGGLTYASFKLGAEKLRRYLRSLPTSGIDSSEPDEFSKGIVDRVSEGMSSAAEAFGSAALSAGKQAGEAASEGVRAVSGALAEGAKAAGAAVEGGLQSAGENLGNVAKGIGDFFGSLGKKK